MIEDYIDLTEVPVSAAKNTLLSKIEDIIRRFDGQEFTIHQLYVSVQAQPSLKHRRGLYESVRNAIYKEHGKGRIEKIHAGVKNSRGTNVSVWRAI